MPKGQTNTKSIIIIIPNFPKRCCKKYEWLFNRKKGSKFESWALNPSCILNGLSSWKTASVLFSNWAHMVRNHKIRWKTQSSTFFAPATISNALSTVLDCNIYMYYIFPFVEMQPRFPFRDHKSEHMLLLTKRKLGFLHFRKWLAASQQSSSWWLVGFRKSKLRPIFIQ